MNPKELIQNLLINELQDIVTRHAYLSFAIMSMGIEFIGKCHLTNYNDWNRISQIEAFNKGYDLLIAEDERYGSLNLRDELRHGMIHSLLPKKGIALSEIKHGVEHFSKNSLGQTILVAEVLFEDFVKVCKKTIDTKFQEGDKMNDRYMRIGS